uniref:Movement protein n=1 Tax=Heterorhabditis bacteriophora TaxID=37862 RepID=A0A1I7XRP9_HETBA
MEDVEEHYSTNGIIIPIVVLFSIYFYVLRTCLFEIRGKLRASLKKSVHLGRQRRTSGMKKKATGREKRRKGRVKTKEDFWRLRSSAEEILQVLGYEHMILNKL